MLPPVIHNAVRTRVGAADNGDDNKAYVITIVAVEGQCWVIDSIDFSYDEDPPAGGKVLTAVAGSTKIVESVVTNGGIGQLRYAEEGGVHNNEAVNEAMVITLPAADTNTAGYLFVTYH